MEISSLAKKLHLKENYKLCIINAPDGYIEMLTPLPAGATVDKALEGEYDFIQLFVQWQKDLAPFAPQFKGHLGKKGALWLCYPKQSAKVGTDITRDKGWDAAWAEGLQGCSLISINDVWSAMKFKFI